MAFGPTLRSRALPPIPRDIPSLFLLSRGGQSPMASRRWCLSAHRAAHASGSAAAPPSVQATEISRPAVQWVLASDRPNSGNEITGGASSPVPYLYLVDAANVVGPRPEPLYRTTVLCCSQNGVLLMYCVVLFLSFSLGASDSRSRLSLRYFARTILAARTFIGKGRNTTSDRVHPTSRDYGFLNSTGTPSCH